ncbi:MAG TPA: GNAT family N-acetyltransferase [Bryobacteraceae bacterium]|nr:GNAT family N-acetyltransferase [Bryobacteraceae bacterium]
MLAATRELRAIRHAADLLELAPQWLALYERSEDASPFQHPDWVLPWREAFSGGELLCFGLWDGQTLVGLAPLFLHIWNGKRQVTFLGNGVSDRLGFLSERGSRERTQQEFFSALARESSRWDLCDLQDLPANFLAPGPPSRGLQWTFEAQGVCSKIELPRDAEEFRAGLPGGLRRNLRRYRDKLKLVGDTVFKSAETETEFLGALEALIMLHSARWNSQGQPGMLGSGLKRFHREAAARLWRRGKARCFTLSTFGRPLAAIYGFFDKGRFWSYQSGFDPEFAPYCPGSLILDYAIAEAIREGAREFDFLRGSERYKLDWGARFESSYRLLLSHLA